MKRITALALATALIWLVPAYAHADEAPSGVSITAPSAVLMEKSTGTILYEQEAHAQYEPASVTKVMTLLLVMEAIDAGNLSWEDTVTASAYACSMGGSQIWLKENEHMSVSDMVKAVAVASANDCAVALAEHLAGSEESFVERMNQRAAELGMEHTVFHNCTGLPAEGHVSCAYDIALMSRELILNHPDIRQYTTIWMDTLRDGQFQLSNTNRLIFYYEGATGLKTGSTDSALYCLSATAERDGMELIAVVLKSPTSDRRFEGAKALLNYGFANYALVHVTADTAIPTVPVTMGRAAYVQPVLGEGGTLLLEKARAGGLTQEMTLTETVKAPVEQGQRLGTLRVLSGEETVAEIPLVAGEAVERLGYGEILERLLALAFLGRPYGGEA